MIVMPCFGGKEGLQVESDIASCGRRIQVCLLPSKPVNTILNIHRSVPGGDESVTFQCSFSE